MYCQKLQIKLSGLSIDIIDLVCVSLKPTKFPSVLFGLSGWGPIASIEYHCVPSGNGNPLQYSCQGNPMDRGAWQAIVQGTAESDIT